MGKRRDPNSTIVVPADPIKQLASAYMLAKAAKAATRGFDHAEQLPTRQQRRRAKRRVAKAIKQFERGA